MWALIIFIYAGVFSKGDSVALTNVYGFKSKNLCEIAIQESQQLSKDTFKSTRAICFKVE